MRWWKNNISFLNSTGWILFTAFVRAFIFIMLSWSCCTIKFLDYFFVPSQNIEDIKIRANLNRYYDAYIYLRLVNILDLYLFIKCSTDYMLSALLWSVDFESKYSNIQFAAPIGRSKSDFAQHFSQRRSIWIDDA